MDDHKAGMPRTSYRGVLQYRCEADGRRVYLLPRRVNEQPNLLSAPYDAAEGAAA
jgi:hypothetical protein